MVAVSENTLGFDREAIFKVADGKIQPFKTGQSVRGDNGKLFQYAKATEAIAGGTATVNITVSNGEYVAAATGGSATSPAAAMVADDFGFFQL